MPFSGPSGRHSQIVRKLVASGADVDASCEPNETLIFVAVKNADDKTVQVLIELGVDIAKESLLYDAAWMGNISRAGTLSEPCPPLMQTPRFEFGRQYVGYRQSEGLRTPLPLS
jgi:ankyrin repeat protein